MSGWFNERKSAQVAAFFCGREGGRISVLKLTKLIYLSDREAMSRYGFPITNDRLVAMPHGPVNSLTYSFVRGEFASDAWGDLISDRDGYEVGLARQANDDDTDELSDADVEVLESVWQQFGHMNKWAIRDWTHKNCPEWEDPDGSSNPIPHSRVLKFLGVEGAEEYAKEITSERNIDSLFASLKAG